jgi:ribosome maturation factor RimP
MDLAGRVEALIGPTVDAMGYSLVRVQILGRNRPRLQIMAERTDGESMLVDDCAAISRAVSAVLDVEDPIAGAFTLEVSSPGIDRPLVRLADFDRFAGFEAKVEMDLAVDGRRRFQGRLLGTEGDAVRLRMEDSEVVLPYADIRRAKLVLTEELLATGGH